MFPIGDDDTERRTLPMVTYALIALNILMFLAELSGGDQFVNDWAFIPERFSTAPASNAVTIFTAMFMHGSWFHLLGNMLFLWIFGDNVEDSFGHVQFLIFYLLVGVAATLAQFAVSPHSDVPNLGASGAIAGVLGAYILMFPQQRVNVLFGPQIVAMPAIIVIGLWIALQLFSGIGMVAHAHGTADVGGIAYLAHIGGFFAGFLLAFLFRGEDVSQT